MDRLTDDVIRDVFHTDGVRVVETRMQANGTTMAIWSPDVSEQVPLACCLDALRTHLPQALLRDGAVLLRGFAPLQVSGLDAFASAFGDALQDYTFGSTPRSQVEGRVYSSTEYPATQWIDQHNEQSYTLQWPKRIWFYCDIPATEGGATPIADSRTVYTRLRARLPQTVLDRFEREGVMYLRNYGNGLDVPWEQVFGTSDRDVVAAYCTANRIDYEWLDDGEALRTRQICQAVWRHPVTHAPVWFNQAHLFHLTNLPVPLREALLEAVEPDRLPRNTCFGDGTPIDDAILDEIRAVYQETMLSFTWREGDLLVLDNLLASHGRAPFSGKRRVVVAMSGASGA
ncbi:TauD/TfdA family dioxygenase [Robbsia andropogonis]|nr:TauD/TfdA family dioxygenase [Robbsia andropogonis]MCP1119386.1 TauD/TfdA family dioxygenase [Robbsia andropogonis]MCP1129227.1 TauD/TfdA family dioxygenase [Robbsia andropogonis]